ncbi:MAG: TetR/AcrR family transcriptional regulator [Deltaproteobacteria bacterium]|nr:TetR/AcrR family transcriptional regulator [Deltaproteobacteria bacterium]
MTKLIKSLKAKKIKPKRPNGSVRSPKKEELVATRESQIAAGASNVMLKKGYHAATTREIAQECGMSMGQLYSYITSKDDILYIVFRQMYQVFIEHIQMSKQEKAKDPVDRLRKALFYTLKFTGSQRKFIQLLFTESRHLDKPHLDEILDMDKKFILTFWREMLSEFDLFKTSEKDLDFAASVVHYLLVFLPLRSWTVADRPLEENINSLIEFILRGLGLTGAPSIK